MNIKRLVIFVPILLAIIPSFSLYSANKDVAEVSFLLFLLALFIIGLCTFIFLLLFRYIFKDDLKATNLTILVVFTIFYYGYFFRLLQRVYSGSMHWMVITLWCFISIIVGFYILLTKRNLNNVSKIIGIFVFSLFIVSVSFFLIDELKNNHQNWDGVFFNNTDSISQDVVKSTFGYVPDVYYIVPDGYANSKVLEEFFSYNNSEFISYLKSKKFTIVDNSESNYCETLFSLPTIMNMEYGEKLIKNYLSSPRAERREFLERNKTVNLFKKLGYKYVSIFSESTAFSGKYADEKFGSSMFFRLLISPTIFDPLFMRPRQDVLVALEALKEVSTINGPKFVFAHILSPHAPYVFGSNGENIGINYGAKNSSSDMEIYLGQLEFVNKELEKILDAIFKNSAHTPIIIIQSDHGFLLPNFYKTQTVIDKRFKNFNAYFIPEGIKNSTGTITTPPDTNINTFRFIFDQYFGTKFGLLENEKFYSDSCEK